MKQCLVDVNVLLALPATKHEHHENPPRVGRGSDTFRSRGLSAWSVGVDSTIGKLSGDGSIPMSAGAAWDLIESELLLDERFEFVVEPPTVGLGIRELLRYPGPTGKLVGDAYVAAFAITSARQLVTLDGAFRQFRGLHVRLLRSN